MSVEAMALALHHSKSKGTAKLVLLGIANHDGDGGAWPSVKTLAKYGGCDSRQVQRALKQLEQAGEIQRIIGAGGDENTRPDRRPNRYRILVSCPPSCDGTTKHKERGDSGDTPRRDGVTSTAERGDIRGSNGVVEMSPEPSYEPSVEPLAAAPRESKPRPKDDIFEAVANACAIPLDRLTATERGRINKAAKELRDIGTTPDEIARKAQAYRQQYPDMPLTPQALTGNWAQLTPPPRKIGTLDRYCHLCGLDITLPYHEQECANEAAARNTP